MKRKYRIKAIQREDIETWLNTQYMDIAPCYNVYAVQMRIFPFVWVTIKEFDDDSDWVGYSRAQNLMDELNKETL
jgi:hypothetical protein